MKGIISILAFFVATIAQAQTISYQGVARDNVGDIVANQAIGLQMTIRQGSGTGTIVYQETHAPTTNEFGLFTIAIGGGTPTSGTFNTIDWSTMNYWLETAADMAGGTTYVSLGANEFKAVPYAMYAASSPADGDSDPNNEIELPAGGNNGDVLTTNGAGVVSWQAPSTGSAATDHYVKTTSVFSTTGTYQTHGEMSFSLEPGLYKMEGLFKVIDPPNVDMDMRFSLHWNYDEY